jgi:hypothetical protein
VPDIQLEGELADYPESGNAHDYLAHDYRDIVDAGTADGSCCLDTRLGSTFQNRRGHRVLVAG